MKLSKKIRVVDNYSMSAGAFSGREEIGLGVLTIFRCLWAALP